MTAATSRYQQQAAAIVTAGLIVLGAVLGVIWAAWSPTRPGGFGQPGGPVQATLLPGGLVGYNETSESFAASDGRYVFICAVVGLIAGAALWSWRSARGPGTVLALAVGGVAGAWVMEQAGHLAGRGTDNVRNGTFVPHLALTVHMTGIVWVEALLAVLVYSMLAAFAVDDDLGRPDPARDEVRRRPIETPELVSPQYLVQYRGADGDAPGLPQQDQLPPQDPRDRA